MGMNIWRSALMGLVSGFAELMPLSPEAHRSVLRCLMGIEGEDPALRFVYHLAALAALLLCRKRQIADLRKASKLMKIPARRRRREPDPRDACTVRHFKTAAVIVAFMTLFTSAFSHIADELQILAFSVIGSGVLLLLPSLVRSGNKDSRNMPRLDSLLMALGAGLSAIPGFSAVGGALAVGVSRGVDRRFALKFAWLLLIPALLVRIVFDIFAIFGGAAVTAGAVSILVGGIFAFAGAWLGCRTMKKLILSTNGSSLSYYCFGMGLLIFVLFLTV